MKLTYINSEGIEVIWNKTELELLGYIRHEIGDYCNDSYFLPDIHAAMKQDNPKEWLHDQMSMIALNAIATDSSGRWF